MTFKETVDYILSNIKPCKIKGDPYILVYKDHLYIIDQDLSALYSIELLYPDMPVIANKLSIIAAENYDGSNNVNYSILNMMLTIVSKYYIQYPMGLFRPISRAEVDYDIPNKASENSKFTRYYLNDDPTVNILVPEFYNMVPITKADTYDMYMMPDRSNGTTIIVYVIQKKKPKATITIYRRILDLH